MTVRLLVNIARPDAAGDPLDLARAAEAAGLDGVGFADSPRLFPDTFLSAQRVLANTGLPLAGPCVLGLGLHHPSVVARSLRTLDRHHPGRAVLVVGRGESSVHNEGLPVPSMAEYESKLGTLRERWDDDPGDVVVLGAASGPRTIAATAGRLGGVLIDVGADPAVIDRALRTARESSPSVRCWLFLRAVVTDGPAAATAAAAPLLGSCAARLVRSPRWFGVAPADLERIAAVAAAHDYRRHGSADARPPGSADQRAEAMITERFLLTGTGNRIAEQLASLAGAGLDGVVLAGAVAGIDTQLAATAAAVRRGLTPAGAEPEGPR